MHLNHELESNKNLPILTIFCRDDENVGEIKKFSTEFHTVFAFEENLLHSLRNTLKKGDSIYLSGHMKTNSFYNEAGERKHSGMIVADTIYKRASLDQIKAAQKAFRQAKVAYANETVERADADELSDSEGIDHPSKF